MKFNRHSDLEGTHAFLSPSSYHWLRYSDEKLIDRFQTVMTARRGTQLHDLAHQCIILGVKLPDEPTTLNMYVNDAIYFNMRSEVSLFYSPNCYGHADTCSFWDNLLRIHDLKNGVTPASFDQLMIYAALFCLEYAVSPYDIDILLRIYQSDEVLEKEPYAETIEQIMERIVRFDQLIETYREEGSW